MSNTPTPSAESQERSAAIRCLFPDTESSQESQESQSQNDESQSTPELDGRSAAAESAIHVVEPMSPEQDSEKETINPDPAAYTPEHGPTTEDSETPLEHDSASADPDPAACTPERSPATDGSQAIEMLDSNHNADMMEHDEYKELICHKTEQRRIVRNTSRPTLWRHQRRPLASVCMFDAVDNGVCIAMTGVMWSVDARMYEVVLVCTLGWSDPLNKKSHHVGFSQPIYVILRDACLKGMDIKFCHLLRCLASVLFREGRPKSEISFKDVGRAKKLVDAFAEKNGRNYDAWQKISYLYTRSEIEARRLEEEEVQRRREEKAAAARRKREDKQEKQRKKREIQALQKKEREARVAAEKAARKTARAQAAKRKREIQSIVRVIVQEACKNLNEELQEQFANAIETSRAEVDGDLGHRISQVEEAVENNLVHQETFSKYRASVDKRFNKLAKKLKKVMVIADGEHVAARAVPEDENDVPCLPPQKRVKKTKVWRQSTALCPIQPVSESDFPSASSVMSPQMIMPAARMRMGTPRPVNSEVWGAPRIHTMFQDNVYDNNHQYMSSIFGQRHYTR